ncbi:damage-control phosphatase ARMT1-like [Cloeon dipterum]|uniref:damage-control phosphatase ARMT1-like n=1 Tax=Cloeon dipterum TaxID=197152 RepID=UPI00321F768A
MSDESSAVFNDKSLDEPTPAGAPLTAKYKQSFAYDTIKDRLPVIITKTVDHLYRDKNKIIEQFGEEAREDIKSLIGSFSKLRNELQTNKPLVPINLGDDVDLWNSCVQGGKWFDSPWLLVECYLYRRMRDNIAQSPSLSDFDQFSEQKKHGFAASTSAMKGLEAHLNRFISDEPLPDLGKEQFFQLLKVSLWGNKCDMSLSGGEQRHQNLDPIKQLPSLEKNILCNHLENAWAKILKLNGNSSSIIDIVLDNAGFELFTDLCLADFLVSRQLVSTVRFHAKNMPWFVSDATPMDIFWSLEYLEDHIPELGFRWRSHVHSGKWVLHPSSKSSFWTLPHAFAKMKEVDPDLFNLLSSSSLVIFKGDLNYRKLVGDLNWDPQTELSTAFEGCPKPLLALRTLKADVVVGLEKSVIAKMTGNWMVSGEYAVIQLCD